MVLHSLICFQRREIYVEKQALQVMYNIHSRLYLLITALRLDMHCGKGTKATPRVSRKRPSSFPRMNFCNIFPLHPRKQTYTKVRKIFLLGCNDSSSRLAAHVGFDKSEDIREYSYYRIKQLKFHIAVEWLHSL